ncbi:unnamed protein product [Gongylonema pulchrum]|uniref:PHB domain-containing protein n=1 Tax=Gongylonema pulchrum TaxID=637853 RepID=A0A183DU73_9BILA|nr:unnamed protein product [Gongylonema pulchrum]
MYILLFKDNNSDVIEKIPIRARSQSWLIRTRHLLDHTKVLILVVVTFPFCLPFCLKVAREYERAVVMRLGRLIDGGTKGPGLFFIMPCIDTFRIVDLRVLSFDVPPQEILSRDSVTVSVEAVIYFRVNNPVISVTNVNDAQFSTKLLAQTTLRNVLGTRTLNIRLPHQLMRSMAAEAEAARDARALIIHADGERKASWFVFLYCSGILILRRYCPSE